MVNFGPDYGKLCVIIDVLDQNRAYVDGPSDVTGVQRQQISFKWLTLTKYKVNIGHSARLKSLRKAFADAKIIEQWEQSARYTRMALFAKKQSLTDFDRFRVMLVRKKRSRILQDELYQMRSKRKTVMRAAVSVRKVANKAKKAKAKAAKKNKPKVVKPKVEKPKQKPKEKSKEKPKQKPKEKPKQAPKEKPKQAPKEKPKQAPKEKSKEPRGKPKGQPKEKTTKKAT